jgi:hypothetical protein
VAEKKLSNPLSLSDFCLVYRKIQSGLRDFEENL